MTLNIHEIKSQLDKLTYYVLSLQNKTETNNTVTLEKSIEDMDLDELRVKVAQLESTLNKKCQDYDGYFKNQWTKNAELDTHIGNMYAKFDQTDTHINKLYTRLGIEINPHITNHDGIERLDEHYTRWEDTYKEHIKNGLNDVNLISLVEMYNKWKYNENVKNGKLGFDNLFDNWYEACKNEKNSICNQWWENDENFKIKEQ